VSFRDTAMSKPVSIRDAARKDYMMIIDITYAII